VDALPANPHEVAQPFNPKLVPSSSDAARWSGAVNPDVAGLGDEWDRCVARESDDAGRDWIFLSWHRYPASAQHTRSWRDWLDDGVNVTTSALHADSSLAVYPTTQARYASTLFVPAESDDSSASRRYDTAVSHPMDAIQDVVQRL